jgi:hypothetical protein
MKRVIPAVLCAGSAIYWLLTQPPGPVTSPDSAAYLEMAPIVPLGYPLLLNAFGAAAIVRVQPFLFALALAALANEILTITASLPLVGVLIIGVVLTPDLATYHASILTESLFMSGVVAALACGVRLIHRRRWPAAAAAGTIIAIVSTIRLAASVLVPALVVIELLLWTRIPKHRVAILLALVLPSIAAIAGERALARAIHGADAGSLAGRHAFAKAALIDAAPSARHDDDPIRAQLDRDLEVRYAPVRDLVARAPQSIRQSLMLYYETCLQWPCAEPTRAALSARSDAERDQRLLAAAIDRIRRAPAAFAALTATHVAALWTPRKLQHPDTASALTKFLAANRPLPFEREAFRVDPREALNFSGSGAVRWLQLLVHAAAWMTALIALAALIALVARRDTSNLFLVAALSSLVAHGGVLFSALFAAGIARFMISFWPAVIVATTTSAWWLLRVLLPRLAVAGYDWQVWRRVPFLS